MRKGGKENEKKLRNIIHKHNLQVAASVTSKRSATRASNAFEDGKKSFDTDLCKTGTEGNYLFLELDTLKGLRVDEKRITFDRRSGNRKQSYAEVLTGNCIGAGKNPTVEENQIDTLSNFNDDDLSDDKVSTTPEKVEETYSTKSDDTCVTSEKNSKKCNLDKEKTKLKSAQLLKGLQKHQYVLTFQNLPRMRLRREF